jgi:hypothetical protein
LPAWACETDSAAAVVGIPQRMRDYNRRQKGEKTVNPFSSPKPPES